MIRSQQGLELDWQVREGKLFLVVKTHPSRVKVKVTTFEVEIGLCDGYSANSQRLTVIKEKIAEALLDGFDRWQSLYVLLEDYTFIRFVRPKGKTGWLGLKIQLIGERDQYRY